MSLMLTARFMSPLQFFAALLEIFFLERLCVSSIKPQRTNNYVRQAV